MSRLDDELRFALRREQPSPDFADRVMGRIAERKARQTVWQRLLIFFQPQPFRWVAAGATAALIIAAALWLYPQVERKSSGQGDLQANSNPAPDVAPVPDPEANVAPKSAEEVVKPQPNKPQPVRRRVHHRVETASHRKERMEKSEGEIAKERLMLALQIASAKLNEAQRIVQNED